MQKRVFRITIINNEISVQEKIDNEFIPLRKEGEDSFEFDGSFWDWFKQKIEYQNEPLEFIVKSDREIEFDSSLNISKIEYPNITKYSNKSSNELKEVQEERKKPKGETPLVKFLINKVKKYKEQ